MSALASIARQPLGFVQRRVLRQLPLTALEQRVPRDLIVFMYHVVADEPLPHIRHLYAYKSTAEFAADIAYLKTHYQLPTWPEFASRRGQQPKTGRPAAMVTFDDGLSQCYNIVRPILLQQQVPAIFFIVKKFVDNQQMFYRHKVSLCLERLEAASPSEQSRLLGKVGGEFGIGEFSPSGFRTWINGLEIVNEASIDQACELLEINIAAELQHHQPYLTSPQVVQLAREGFTIGGHSVHHGYLQLLGDQEWEREIVASCDFVAQLVGTPAVPFAFPFDATGFDRSKLQALLQRHPSIQALFGTGGLATDASIIINRIASDEPSRLAPNQSRLEQIIRDRYIDQACQA